MMLIEQTTVPVAALPLSAFKDHMRLGTGFADAGVQDQLLEQVLRSAISTIEGRIGKILLSRDFIWRLYGWRDRTGQPLPVAPIVTLQSLRVLDRVGDAEVIAPERYSLQKDTHRPKLMPTGGALPTIPVGGEAEVSFQAGFGPDWSDIPDDLVQAVYLLATQFYEHRHEAGDEPIIPAGVNALIARYRTVRILGGGAG